MQILLDDLHTAMQMECRSEISFRVWSHFILQRHRGGLQGWTKVYSRYEERRFCLPWFWNVRRRDVYRFSVCDPGLYIRIFNFRALGEIPGLIEHCWAAQRRKW
jgi:hypothetical protein